MTVQDIIDQLSLVENKQSCVFLIIKDNNNKMITSPDISIKDWKSVGILDIIAKTDEL